ncbi:tetratricopeptide repeat protein [Pseudoalteromonas sp. SCSIO 43201]|uniref:tetratricopeptide repeat protein n=1 Tax=Pseudoalteromonas sp. SCSIO 43201 TaxID=2822842 RepID=UPI002075C085|nr:tetratricopeptide repeat protein [Pseudoalteromonas sp. SCSIO 43201]USD30471.1 tetratricopeptide repeat protein [Pseudoalteromonas sp. SCSIO 43201]
MQTNEMNTTLKNALNHIQANQPSQALFMLEKFAHSNHPDIHYLIGICHKAQENWPLAISSLSTAYKLSPQKSEILSHIAKCYWLSAQYTQAEAHYLQIASNQPTHQETIKNLALLYLEQNKFSAAEKWAMKGQGADRSGQFTKILGDIHKAQDNLNEAIKCYLAVPQDAPVAFRAIHNLGLCYKLQTKFELAIQCFQFVHTHAPEQYEPLYNLGDCYFANGQFQLAQQAYQHALKVTPYNTTVHKALNELYWQNGQHELFAISIKEALYTATDNKRELKECLAELYWNTNQYQACKACITNSGFASSSSLMQTLLGRLAAKEERFDDAFQHLDNANKITPEHDRLCEQAKFALQLGNFDVANQLLLNVLKQRPDSQLALAWLSVLYRATDEQKHQHLCDPNFVLTTTLSAPKGYDSNETFLQELEACLIALHQGKQAPSEQTLVNGSQISGGLLNRDIDIIAKTKTQLLADVDRCLNQLSAEQDHPFLAHLHSERKITGSWSVKLSEQGFHVSHIHPAGWISVVLYINTPEDDSNSGLIEFGRPPLAPPYDFPPFKSVKPRRGQIVIFPSYFWHGTQPFQATDSSYRMTLPLDIGILKN